MSSKSDDTSSIALIALVVFGGLVFLALRWVMSAFEVPLPVAVEALYRMGIWAVLVSIAFFYLQANDLPGRIQDSWPIFMGTSVIVFSPILKHWAGGRFGDPLFIEPAWYGKDGWQTLMTVGVIALGYVLKWWWDNK
ncbi:hypothetical protein I6L41_06175 [Aeromonas sp. FDAARGOS 1411]|uniref:hypothetical protein n=1 Tax=Aeromonas TaxID=642 RepID=UPI001C24217E|nr:hypothetical protein [Aeromonas sp. FDAARGOS 1411]QWZ95845.1 hypothetical protein I6L41_06055 [Aeromonas sp. FDAARGOS 1411]QWZ95857.1 hypothetical protein I6L41_06115 [Aeromonas sp. FDAARGOS 1411]QWZ95869.1 hypothetical protein I6L41_06175 [Aeromonas sp. FDAARGOS 1411]